MEQRRIVNDQRSERSYQQRSRSVYGFKHLYVDGYEGFLQRIEQCNGLQQ